MYANLQMRRDSAVQSLLRRIPALAARFDPEAVTGAAPGSAGVFALAAIPARYALERGWHPGVVAPVAAGDDAEEPVGGRRGVEVDGEGEARPHVEVRAGLPVGVPADARVVRAVAGAGVLVDDAEALVVEQPRVAAQQSPPGRGEERVAARLVGRRRQVGDIADVVGEGLAPDLRLRVVEHVGAVAGGQLTPHEPSLGIRALAVEGGQLVLVVEAPHEHEAEPLVEGGDGVEFAGAVGREGGGERGRQRHGSTVTTVERRSACVHRLVTERFRSHARPTMILSATGGTP